MSGYPAGGGGSRQDYDDGYAHPHQSGNADSYYQDDQYYDNGYDAHGQPGDNGYYDESCVLFNARPSK